MEKPIKVNWWLPVLNVIIILGLFVWGNSCLYAREQKSQLNQASLEQVQELKNKQVLYDSMLETNNDYWSDTHESLIALGLRVDKLEQTVSKMLGCTAVCDDETYIGNCTKTYPYEVWDSIEVKPWIYKVFYQNMFSVGRQKQYNETYESKQPKVGALKCFTLDEVVWTAQE